MQVLRTTINVLLGYFNFKNFTLFKFVIIVTTCLEENGVFCRTIKNITCTVSLLKQVVDLASRYNLKKKCTCNAPDIFAQLSCNKK